MSDLQISVIIPSNDLFVNKEYIFVEGGITPIDEDNSLWPSVIYEIWGIFDIANDIEKRIDKLNIHNYENEINNIEEGLRIFKEKLEFSPYVSSYMDKKFNILHVLLDHKKRCIEDDKIENMANKLIDRIELLYQKIKNKDINYEQIQNEKKGINIDTSIIRSMGASNIILKSIGKKIYEVYRMIL